MKGSAALLTGTDPALVAEIEAGMAQVEARLREVVRSSHPLLTESAAHLVEAGGKRVRPLLTLLAAQLGDASNPQVVEAAVVVELTHLATLYHDDVMDEADVRRGAASVNARWTNTVAILTGDYLFARASDLTAGLGTEATHLQSRTFARLVEGQISETAGPAEGDDPVAHHLKVLADKTASLLSTSARLGALSARVPAEVADLVAEFGEVFGVAFQLSDDLIDVLSESAQSGKTPGTDLREGIATLPVLLVRAADDPASVLLARLLQSDLSSDAALAEALRQLRAHPSIGQAREVLESYVQRARDVADQLPPGHTREAFRALTDFVLARTG
jgi:heptaprenyl diphosphate synthase